MPVALPLDLALLVVDYAHPRRLDESAVEHLQRLTRLALVCKAFHQLVRRTLGTTVRIRVGLQETEVVSERLREAALRGRPVETLVVGNLANNTGRVLPESSASLRKVVLVGPALVLFFPCDFAKELYPALHSLSLSVGQIRSLPPCPASSLALTELLLAGPRENLIREFIHPSVTPLLRHLCLLKLDFARTQSPSVFSDIELFRRLEALEISYRRTPPAPSTAAFAPHFPVPALLRTHPTAFTDVDTESIDSGVAYIQLQSVGRFSLDTAAPNDDTTLDLICTTLHRLIHRIEQGLRPKVLFLPDILDPDVTPIGDLRLGETCALFFATLKKHGNPFISWYCADKETDASPSEPFRRYLDRERLEGRM